MGSSATSTVSWSRTAGRAHGATTTTIINNTIAFNTTGLGADQQRHHRLRAGVHRQQHLLAEPRPDDQPRRASASLSRRPTSWCSTTTCSRATEPATRTPREPRRTSATCFDPGLLGPTAADARPTSATTPAIQPSSLLATRGPAPTARPRSSATPTSASRHLGGHQQRLGRRRRPRPTSWATKRTPTRPPRASTCLGYGPRDVGAFEFEPLGTTGTRAVGGTFRVVTTSLVPDGGAKANGTTLYVSPAPARSSSSFSRPVNPVDGHRDRPDSLRLRHQPALTGQGVERHLARRPHGPVQPRRATQPERHDQRLAALRVDQEHHGLARRRLLGQGLVNTQAVVTVPGHPDTDARPRRRSCRRSRRRRPSRR